MEPSRIRSGVYSLCLVLFVLVVILLVRAYLFLSTPMIAEAAQGQDYMLLPGTSVKTFAKQLRQRQLIYDPYCFQLLARYLGVSRNLQAGEYHIEPGMTPKAFLTKVGKGDVNHHQFTVVEGWRVSQLLASIKANPHLRHDEPVTEDNVVLLMGLPDKLSAEGLFLPETYHFVGGMTELAFLKRAHESLKEYLTEAWRHRDKNLWYQTPYQALIAASLIEKEIDVPAQRAMVAAVILKRLQKGMRLQMDSSVIYGLRNVPAWQVHDKPTRMDNAYNTYKHKGLPPTPIALPSKQAIKAALHPAKIQALFFVNSKNGHGLVFSNTLKEHNKAVAKYRQQLKLDLQQQEGSVA